MRPLTVSLLLLSTALVGCRVATVEAPRATDQRGKTDHLRYLLEPGDGATGVPLVPIVRWDKRKLAKDLGAIRRLTIQIATVDGEMVYRAESTEPGKGLFALTALRIFSRPDGTSVQADPAHGERGRLSGARRYQLSLSAEGMRGKGKQAKLERVLESVVFETEEAPAESGD